MRVSESPSDKYLDQTSLQYLVEKIKEEIKKNGGSSGENVDLSDYYTKSQIDDIVKKLPSGSTGVGISSVSINSAGHLIVSLTDGTSTDVGNVVGKNGTNGKDGVDGKNGIDGVMVRMERTARTVLMGLMDKMVSMDFRHRLLKMPKIQTRNINWISPRQQVHLQRLI